MPEPRPEFAALLAAPLLGESGQQAARRCAALRADPDLSLLEDGLLSFIMGELSRVAGQPDATAQLARAARLLGEAGALPLELRARVAVARALVKRPALVIADEPTANLDSVSGENVLELMRKLNEELGVTFLFSTHDPMVMERARRIVHIKDGCIAADEARAPLAPTPES